jgi:glutamate-1-semialdehyde 2,1-aminomutase
LASGLASVIGDAGFDVQVPVAGPLLGVFFSDRPVADYDDARAAATNGHYARLFGALLDQGIAFAPSPYEVLFPSLAHTDADISRTVDVVAAAASALRA